jgi:hypothetical protein
VLSDAALALIAGRFRALSEPLRLRLLNKLMEGEFTVSQLVGMVATRREGLNTYCSIADPTVVQLCELMCARLKAEHEERARHLDGV